MRKTLIYDLPTRLFHWLFATLFLITFAIGKASDDESLVFSYHMLLGLMLTGLVIWRILWGVIGSQHARFSGFNLNIIDLKNYFLGILTGSKKKWTGHNPASSWAAITMFALTLGLGITGYLMSTGSREAFEDIHELMANTFIIVTVLHIAGVILHSFRHQDAIALSMVDGRKELVENNEEIKSSRPFSAILLLAIVFSMGLSLWKNFDAQNRTLVIFGQTLQLSENENENDEKGSEGGSNKESSENDEEGEEND